MARPKDREIRVTLKETAGADEAGVARALHSWAVLLADQADRLLVTRLQAPSTERIPPKGR